MSLAVAELQKLDKLARAIRDRYDTTRLLVVSAKERAREAIAEAILCGQALNEAKSIVGYGEWLYWLNDHCAGVDFDTARKWMRLANQCHDIDLKQCGSLRQAYMAAGILEEGRKPEPVIPESPATPFEVALCPSCGQKLPKESFA